MELPFEKTVCRYWRQKFYKIHEQEQTQELRLPDGMPDVGRVISSWGEMILRGKEWSDRNVGISGGVMLWVLYQPEDGGSPQKLESWIPFQSRVEMSPEDADGVIRVQCVLRSVDVRIGSARKLVARCAAGLLIQTLVPADLEMYLPDELPEDIETLSNQYPLRLICETGEKSFSLDEIVERTTNLAIEELIYYRFEPELMEEKVMGNKGVFRGQGNLHVLYRDKDGRLACTDLQIPFAQYADLDQGYEADAQMDNVICLTGLELELEDNGYLHLRCGLVSQFCVTADCFYRTVQDAYSPCRDVDASIWEQQICSVLDSQNRLMDFSHKVPSGGGKMADSCFLNGVPMEKHQESGPQIVLEGHFQCVLDHEDALECKTGKTTESVGWESCKSSDTVCFVRPSGVLSSRSEGTDWRIHTQRVLNLSCLSNHTIPTVTQISFGELHSPTPDHPSLVIRSKGETSSLWDIAKECGSTVSAIKRMNHLEDEPDADKLLLIPVF